MSIDTLYQRMGGTQFPLDVSQYTDSFAALDSTRDRLLELFAAAANAEFGDAWASVTGALPSGHVLKGTQPVQDKLPMEPNAQLMGQRKTAFPLLALHRTGSPTYEEHLIDQGQKRQQWLLHWVLGPLDIEAVRKLSDLCPAFGDLVWMVIRQRGHAAFESGALQFFPGTGSLSSVRLVNQVGFGETPYGGDETSKLYWSTVFTLETLEVAYDDQEAFGNLDAVDIRLNGGDGTQVVPALILAASDVPFQDG
jgi:hypothetical protein